jgi:hypothetical protein
MKFRDHLCDLRVLIMELIYFVPSIMGHCSVLVEGRRTTKVRILGKVLQAREMLVPDRKRVLQMSIFLSVGHNMTTYLRTVPEKC